MLRNEEIDGDGEKGRRHEKLAESSVAELRVREKIDPICFMYSGIT